MRCNYIIGSHMGKRKAKSSAIVNIPWLQYIEFKNQLLAVNEFHSKKSSKFKKNSDGPLLRRYKKLVKILENPEFFCRESDSYQTYISWPAQSGLYMSAKIIEDRMIGFRFRSERESNPFLEIKLDFINNIFETVKHQPEPLFLSNHLDDILSDFYQIKVNQLVKTKDAPKKLVTQDEFKAAIDLHKQRSLTTRLQKTLSSESIFWLTWNAKPVQIKVTPAPFLSYVLSEKELLKEFYPSDKFSCSLRYYQIEVNEEMPKKDPLLLLWTTLEALVMEIFKLYATTTFSGNEILQLFRELVRLIQPQHLFLQDLSNIFVPKPMPEIIKKTETEVKLEGIYMPLRVINTLLTGNTWYGKHFGVSPMTRNGWESGWSKSVTITQSADDYFVAAENLRSMPFNTLLDFWKNDADWLLSVAKKCTQESEQNKIEEIDYTSLTAQSIFKVVFDRKNHKTLEGYEDLEKLSKHFKWNEYQSNIESQDCSKTPVHFSNRLTSKKIKKLDQFDNHIETMMHTRFFYGSFKDSNSESKTTDEAAIQGANQKRFKLKSSN